MATNKEKLANTILLLSLRSMDNAGRPSRVKNYFYLK